MKNLSYVLASSSPIIAAGASYGINWLAVLGLSGAESYTAYLQLQSWAVYIGSVFGFCLVDLNLNPNSRTYKTLDLYWLVLVLSTTLAVLVFFLGQAIIERGNLLLLLLTGLSFCLFRNLVLVSLILKMHKLTLILRIVRAFLLMSLGLIVLALPEINASQFVALQAVAAAVPAIYFSVALLQVSSLSRVNFKQVVKVISTQDRTRLLRRNGSYAIDMSHTPLYLIGLTGLSVEKNFGWAVYLIGLMMPACYILNQVLAERLKSAFALDSTSEFVGAATPWLSAAKTTAISFFGVITVLTLIAINVSFGTIESRLLLLGIIAHFLLILVSPFAGLVIPKLGLESLDLAINVGVLLLMLTLISVTKNGIYLTIFLCGSLILKFIAQFVLAYIAVGKFAK